MGEMNGKEIPEYIIRKNLEGQVFFGSDDESLIDYFEEGGMQKFERFDKELKLRGFEGMYKLYFIENNDIFKKQARSLVIGAGANFETLLGVIFECHGKVPQCHLYHIGKRFDLDRLSDMVYSLFTESGINKIRETARRIVLFADE